jgi:hypothetical protein
MRKDVLVTESLIGKSKPEAVGDILRSGLDFRIVEENGERFYAPKDDIGMVHLSVSNRKVTNATLI